MRNWTAANTSPAQVRYPSPVLPDGGVRTAFFDRDEVHLSVEYEDGRSVELPWPEEWGDHVTLQQLKARGFLIER